MILIHYCATQPPLPSCCSISFLVVSHYNAITPYVHWHPYQGNCTVLQLSKNSLPPATEEALPPQRHYLLLSGQMLYCRHIYGSDRLKVYTRNTLVLPGQHYSVVQILYLNSKTFQNHTELTHLQVFNQISNST